MHSSRYLYKCTLMYHTGHFFACHIFVVRNKPQCLIRHGNSLYCGKWRTISKSHHDFDLDQTMPIVKLIRAIFIYYTHAHTNTYVHTHTHTHTQGEYSIVAVDKPQLNIQ